MSDPKTSKGDKAGMRLEDDPLGPTSEIGSKLRMLFSKVEEEAVPDRFLDLLEKLDQAEQNSGTRKSE